MGYSNPNFTNNTYRRTVFSAIRPAEQLTPNVPPPPMDFQQADIPVAIVQTGRLMPHLYGEGGSNVENNFNGTNHPNQWLSLTPHQLWKLHGTLDWLLALIKSHLRTVKSAAETYVVSIWMETHLE